jgi:phosphotransferase system enzyme I (PtsI)
MSLKRFVMRGIAASPGLAEGPALVLRHEDVPVFYVSLKPGEVENEVARFEGALEASRRQIEDIQGRVREKFGKEQAYFLDAQKLALQDPLLVQGAAKTIREHSVNAEWALQQAVDEIVKRFSALDDPYITERVKDVEDVMRRVLQNLSGNQPRDLSSIEEPAVLVARRLTPSEAIQLDPKAVLGVALDAGGLTSHTAIIARSKGIPAVIGLHSLSAAVVDRMPVLLDGGEGVVILHPSEADAGAFREKRRGYEQRRLELFSNCAEMAETRDGERVFVGANIEFPPDAATALEFGAEGVGLYRTEFLYLNKSPQLPTEEDHYQAYRAVLETMRGKPVVIRTFDLGGEKFFHRVLQQDNFNPVLGMRAIRYCLAHEEVFVPQLRGLLRASVHGDLRIMVPMVTALDEVRRTKEMLASLRDDLRVEGRPMAEKIPFGIMVEVPAVAVTCDLFAPHVDFFSIGTNDLIQYALAIERANDAMAYLYDPLHPAVLRMLDAVVKAGEAAGKEVHICGEMASDTLVTEVLLGLGLRSLSMGARKIPEIKRRVAAIRLSGARSFVRSLLKGHSRGEIRQMVEERQTKFNGARPAAGRARRGKKGGSPDEAR